jgi:Uma2 family endonuclease
VRRNPLRNRQKKAKGDSAMAANPKDVPPYHYYSLDEYFALEAASDARFEYWDGDIICMSGGSIVHYLISSNVVVALANCLRGGTCRAFTGDAAIWTPTFPPYRYPDASVVYGELQTRHVNILDAVVNPVVIVEVLSRSTRTLDEGKKFEAYKAIPTFREYLLIAQDAPHVIHYLRRADEGWEQREVTDIDGSLELESVHCALRLRDIYEGVTFEE